MASRARNASVSLPLAGRVAVQGVEIAQQPQGFCDGTASDRRGSGVGQPAFSGAETTSGPDVDERGSIDAQGCEEWCDMVAADIGSDSAPSHQRNKGATGMGR